MIAMAAVSVMTPLMRPMIAERWFGGINLVYFAPVPLLTGALAVWLFYSILSKRELAPFLSAVGLFMLGFLGLAISLYPNIIPPSVPVWDVVAPRSSVIFGADRRRRRAADGAHLHRLRLQRVPRQGERQRRIRAS